MKKKKIELVPRRKGRGGGSILNRREDKTLRERGMGNNMHAEWTLIRNVTKSVEIERTREGHKPFWEKGS